MDKNLTPEELARLNEPDGMADVIREKIRMSSLSGTFGARAPGVEGTLYDPNAIHRVKEEGNRQLNAYLIRELESTEELVRRFEMEQAITEALAMQARGRAAPLPRPTHLAVAIRAICDDLQSWSNLK